tara:strand:- start:3359 stop:3550 length:192 start_codon:yes stop_codon:yes gene_type:complete
MAAIAVKVYRYQPSVVAVDQAGAGGLTALLTAALAADGVASGDLLAFDTEMVRGEIIVTVLHT